MKKTQTKWIAAVLLSICLITPSISGALALSKTSCPSNTDVSSKSVCITSLYSAFTPLNNANEEVDDIFTLKYTFEVTGLSQGVGGN